MLHSLAVEAVEALGAAELHKVDVALREVKDLVHTHDKVLAEDGYRTRKARLQTRLGVSVVDFPLKISAATSRSHRERQRAVWSDGAQSVSSRYMHEMAISIVSPPLLRSSCAQAANVDRAVCKSSSKPYPSSIGLSGRAFF